MINLLKIAVVTLLISAGSVAVAGAANADSGGGLFVAITGRDATGCGSEATPCRTIQYMVDHTTGGLIAVKGSTTPYRENVVISGKDIGINGYVDGTVSAANPLPTIVGASATSPVLTFRNDPASSASAFFTIKAAAGSGGGVLVDNSRLVLDALVDGTGQGGIGIQLVHHSNLEYAAVLGFATGFYIGPSTTGSMLHVLTRGASGTGVDIRGGTAMSLIVARVERAGGEGVRVSGVGAKVKLYRSEVADNGGEGVAALPGSTVQVDTSTVYANSHYQIGSTGATVQVRNSTVYDSGSIGLGTATAPHHTTSLAVWGTVISGGHGRDCTGAVHVVDAEYNLSADAANSCRFTGAKHDLVHTDPLLGRLANNGGPSLSRLPETHSPLLDRIPLGVKGCPSERYTSRGDQRGELKPLGKGCDIGAVEGTVGHLADGAI